MIKVVSVLGCVFCSTFDRPGEAVRFSAEGDTLEEIYVPLMETVDVIIIRVPNNGLKSRGGVCEGSSDLLWY